MDVKEDIKTLFVQSSWTMKAIAEEMTKNQTGFIQAKCFLKNSTEKICTTKRQN